MTDNEVKFCYKCGASIPEGADFCPECGASIRPDNEPRAEYTARPTNPTKSDLGAVPVLIMVYGVLAVIGAIIVLIFGASLDSFIDMLKELVKQGTLSPQEYDDLMKMLGLVSEAAIEAMRLQIIITGVLMIISGIAAIVSSNFCGKMQNFKTAFGACVLAAALPLLSLIFLDVTGLIVAAVGFVMCYLIYQKKDLFTS